MSTPSVTEPITLSGIQAAHQRIRDYIHTTPILTSQTLNSQLSSQLFFKAENLQKIGAFKSRGAFNALLQLTHEQRQRGVIAFSSGNHAQGVAYAAQQLGIPATIVMPHDAPKNKLAATEGYGAKVIRYNRYTEDREAITQEIAQTHHLAIIPPYNHPHIIAGQGTAALEIHTQLSEPLDYLMTPVGGGGLISGTAVAYKALHPDCKIIGVEPESGNDAQQSLKAGHIIKIDTPQTIADGVQTQSVGSYTFPLIQTHVDDILTATDATLINCMHFFATRMKIVVEPTSCLPLAAILEHKLHIQHKRVGIILSGGNIEITKYADWLTQAQDIIATN